MLSNIGCADPVLNPLLGCSAPGATPFSPGWRNEFHAGLQQALGKYLVFSGEYIWKYTHNAYDFSVLGSTPITFPIEWHNSKIPGFAGRVSVPNYHGFSALLVFSSVAARFFNPQLGGAGAVPAGAGKVESLHSALITTRNSIRPRTCNISPGSAGPGWASTGAMTAGWWRERFRAWR